VITDHGHFKTTEPAVVAGRPDPTPATGPGGDGGCSEAKRSSRPRACARRAASYRPQYASSGCRARAPGGSHPRCAHGASNTREVPRNARDRGCGEALAQLAVGEKDGACCAALEKAGARRLSWHASILNQGWVHSSSARAGQPRSPPTGRGPRPSGASRKPTAEDGMHGHQGEKCPTHEERRGGAGLR